MILAFDYFNTVKSTHKIHIYCMKTTKTQKGSNLSQFIQQRGIVRSFVAKKIGVSYQRFRTILNGAPVYLFEAVRISETLGAPLHELFPQSFQNQSTNPNSESHE